MSYDSNEDSQSQDHKSIQSHPPYLARAHLASCMGHLGHISHSHRNHAVLKSILHKPPIHRIRQEPAHDGRQTHHPPKADVTRIAGDRIKSSPNHHRWNHSGHDHIHGEPFRHDRLFYRCEIGAPHRFFHEQGLKNEKPKTKPRKVLDDHFQWT